MFSGEPKYAYWDEALSGKIRLKDVVPYLDREHKEKINKQNSFTQELSLFFESRKIVEKEMKGTDDFLKVHIKFPGAEDIEFFIVLSRQAFDFNSEEFYNRFIEDQEFRKKIMEENGKSSEEELKQVFKQKKGALTEYEELFFEEKEEEAREEAAVWSHELVADIAWVFIKLCKERAHNRTDIEGIELVPFNIS